VAGTAIVTGGGGDIGGATAALLSRRGWQVMVVDRELAAAESVAGAIAGEDGVAFAVQAEVSSSSSVRAYVERGLER
jgi:2-hydroxycyclohexanecarboxyl-CoA dehydrogenase